jgi:hypothetical protein
MRRSSLVLVSSLVLAACSPPPVAPEPSPAPVVTAAATAAPAPPAEIEVDLASLPAAEDPAPLVNACGVLDPAACTKAARMLVTGWGVAPDVREAVRLAAMACPLHEEHFQKQVKEAGGLKDPDVREVCILRAKLARFRQATPRSIDELQHAAALCRLGVPEGCIGLWLGWQFRLDAKGTPLPGAMPEFGPGDAMALDLAGCEDGHVTLCAAFATRKAVAPKNTFDHGAMVLSDLCQKGWLAACSAGKEMLALVPAEARGRMTTVAFNLVEGLPARRDRAALELCKQGKIGCGLASSFGLEAAADVTKWLVAACTAGRDFRACERAADRIQKGEGARANPVVAAVLAAEACAHGWTVDYQPSGDCRAATALLTGDDPTVARYRELVKKAWQERDRADCLHRMNTGVDAWPEQEMAGEPYPAERCAAAAARLDPRSNDDVLDAYVLLDAACLAKSAPACEEKKTLAKRYEAITIAHERAARRHKAPAVAKPAKKDVR